MEFTFYAIAFQEMQIAFLDFLILSGLQQADVRSRHGKWPQKFQWWFEGCWIHHRQQQRPSEISFGSRLKVFLDPITLCSAAGKSSEPRWKAHMDYMQEQKELSSSSSCVRTWRARGGICAWGVGKYTWAVDHAHLTITHAGNGTDLISLAVASFLAGSHWESSNTLALQLKEKVWESI